MTSGGSSRTWVAASRRVVRRLRLGRCRPGLFALLFALAACTRLGTGLAVLTHLPAGDPAAIRPGHYVTDPDHRFLLLEVAHLGYARVLARFTDLTAEMDLDPAHPERFRLTARIAAASFSSGVAGIDEAVHKLLEAERHPNLVYTASRITRTGPAAARVDGWLTIAGRSAPVSFDVVFNGAAPNPLTGRFTAGFSASGTLSRARFGLSRWAPAVGDEVAFRIEAEFHLAAEKNPGST